MTTSGTFNYGPGAGDLILAAFARVGIRRGQETSEHMFDAFNEANLMLSDWSTRPGPNWWALDLFTQPLTQGTVTYTLPATTIQLVAAYITVGTGASATDRILAPLSAYNYSSLPLKTQQGVPTSFWFNRLITPQIALYPAPDGATPYTLNLRRWRQIQDTTIPGGVQPEIPWRFLDCFVWGLAERLAYIYPPPPPRTIEKIEQRASAAWIRASTNDEENVPIRISPGLASYYS